MQAKGLVRFFLFLLIAICLGQLVYIFPTNRVEKDAEIYAEQATAAVPADQKDSVRKATRINYLDSMSSEKILSIPLMGSYTYQECKTKQLHLGLDLKGGMNVVLQVDLRDFLRNLAENTTDADFNTAIKTATDRQKESQANFIELFAEEFKKSGKSLATIFSRNSALGIDINSSDNKVQNIIREKANATVKETYDRLRQRIDKLGVVQPNVSLDAARDMIVVELPGIDNPERARRFLQAAAELEFWNVYRVAEIGQTIIAADNILKAAGDTTALKDSSKLKGQGPLLSMLDLSQAVGSSAVVGTAKKNQRAPILTMLNRPEVKAQMPNDVVWAWSLKPEMSSQKQGEDDLYVLYALRKTPNSKSGAAMDGERVSDARPSTDDKGSPAVSLSMDNQGTAMWGQITTQAARDNQRQVAVVLDGEVASAPSVNEPILGGSSIIHGNFTVQEAKDLSSILQVGKLPARTEIVQESTVGPSLGQANINNSLIALGVSFLGIMVFMSVYYSTGGIISIIALLANLLFIVGALTSYGTVLTLPGIAGIVLTMGMAVDANVIIYERIREELAAGKNKLTAITEGFKHSSSAIVDGNLTTLITALVLYYFGLGPIKGFGFVLAIGIIFTLFTAVLVSRLITDWWTGKGKDINFFAPFSERAFKNIKVDWMSFRFKAYAISGAIILAGIISMMTRGFELGVAFQGGYSYNVEFKGANVTADQLRSTLTKAFDGKSTIVKAVSTANTYNVTTAYLISESNSADKVTEKLFEGINSLVGNNLKLEEFKKPDGQGTHIVSSAKVSAIIADDIRKSSVWATLIGIFGIGAYILLRFNRWQYSVGGILALFHDVLITLSFFSLLHGILPFSMEVDDAFIAAILTIVGYSINDTVIVYDRIREYMRLYNKKPMAEVINDAINSTLSRTIITSFTVLLVVLILFIFGGESIRGFSFALLVGIGAGTYSSIFQAAPIMMDLSRNNLDLAETAAIAANEAAEKATIVKKRIEKVK